MTAQIANDPDPEDDSRLVYYLSPGLIKFFLKKIAVRKRGIENRQE